MVYSQQHVVEVLMSKYNNMWGGLDQEEGVTSGAGGEGVVALGTAGHVGTVPLDHAVGQVGVELVCGCAGTVVLTIHSDLQISGITSHERISDDDERDDDDNCESDLTGTVCRAA